MSWNYRLFKQDGKTGLKDKHGKAIVVEPFFFVGECYYDDKHKPEMHSSMDHNQISGDSVEEAREAYDMIAEAFKQPVIELDEKGDFKK